MLAAAATGVRAQFTLLNYGALTGVPDLSDQFGAEDKMVFCNNPTFSANPALVFIDLDVTGKLYLSLDQGVTWDVETINAVPCPDPNQPPAPLVPRNGGYTVGVVQNNVTGFDRLIVLGGDDGVENNVYYSDDCGETFYCYDGDQIWDPRDWAPFFAIPGIPDVTYMVGGITDGFMSSVGAFQTSGANGLAWTRPPCTDTTKCVAYEQVRCCTYMCCASCVC